MLRCITLLALFAFCRPAWAEVRLHYVSWSDGLRVLDLRASLSMDADGYAIETDMQTVGLVGVFVGGDSHSLVRGVWRGALAAPTLYDSRGHWRGQPRATDLAYDAGGQPVIRQMVPANDTEREPVPAGMETGTVDTLSAMAALIHRVVTTGRCEGSVRIFDGRRLSEVSARTAGMQVLPPDSRSAFSGAATRCDFDGRLLAGFRYADNRARAARPQHGVAWLAATAPGGPMVPVRIQFQTPFFGQSTMYLAP